MVESIGDTGDIAFGGAVDKAQFGRVQRALAPWLFKPWVVIVALAYSNFFAGRSWEAVLSAFVHRPQVFLGDAIFFAVVSLLYFGIVEMGRRGAWKANEKMQSRIQGVVREGEIEWQGNYTTTRFPWPMFKRVRDLGDLVIVKYSWNCGFYFPRHFFGSEDDWARFKARVAANVGK